VHNACGAPLQMVYGTWGLPLERGPTYSKACVARSAYTQRDIMCQKYAHGPSTLYRI